MSEYFDCIIFKKTKNDKTFARQIGSAKKRDDGGFNVYLDALPPDGNFAILPQKERGEKRGASAKPAPNNGGFDDEIPF